ncbi:conserved Plasmodium protein, unknown function [Plasmodium ovale wallikeri]|uniref:Phosphorylated adapter RNA export protein RNA-binding domain-containing protein n=1 Tax=Plasmodium ovale wallikeri TaxID=864142 RepID=A0A1A8ZQ41_PLAOA|nr:conserved Plasmodium protein, unknown function [Plasmodium ovale wallikeri]
MMEVHNKDQKEKNLVVTKKCDGGNESKEGNDCQKEGNSNNATNISNDEEKSNDNKGEGIVNLGNNLIPNGNDHSNSQGKRCKSNVAQNGEELKGGKTGDNFSEGNKMEKMENTQDKCHVEHVSESNINTKSSYQIQEFPSSKSHALCDENAQSRDVKGCDISSGGVHSGENLKSTLSEPSSVGENDITTLLLKKDGANCDEKNTKDAKKEAEVDINANSKVNAKKKKKKAKKKKKKKETENKCEYVKNVDQTQKREVSAVSAQLSSVTKVGKDNNENENAKEDIPVASSMDSKTERKGALKNGVDKVNAHNNILNPPKGKENQKSEKCLNLKEEKMKSGGINLFTNRGKSTYHKVASAGTHPPCRVPSGAYPEKRVTCGGNPNRDKRYNMGNQNDSSYTNFASSKKPYPKFSNTISNKHMYGNYNTNLMNSEMKKNFMQLQEGVNGKYNYDVNNTAFLSYLCNPLPFYGLNKCYDFPYVDSRSNSLSNSYCGSDSQRNALMEYIMKLQGLYSLNGSSMYCNAMHTCNEYSGNEYSGNGYSGNGYSGNGYSGNGYRSNGYRSNEYSGNGYSGSGYCGNGYSRNGINEHNPGRGSSNAYKANCTNGQSGKYIPRRGDIKPKSSSQEMRQNKSENFASEAIKGKLACEGIVGGVVGIRGDGTDHGEESFKCAQPQKMANLHKGNKKKGKSYIAPNQEPLEGNSVPFTMNGLLAVGEHNGGLTKRGKYYKHSGNATQVHQHSDGITGSAESGGDGISRGVNTETFEVNKEIHKFIDYCVNNYGNKYMPNVLNEFACSNMKDNFDEMKSMFKIKMNTESLNTLTSLVKEEKEDIPFLIHKDVEETMNKDMQEIFNNSSENIIEEYDKLAHLLQGEDADKPLPENMDNLVGENTDKLAGKNTNKSMRENVGKLADEKTCETIVVGVDETEIAKVEEGDVGKKKDQVNGIVASQANVDSTIEGNMFGKTDKLNVTIPPGLSFPDINRALLHGAYLDNIEVVKKCLEKKGDINYFDKIGRRALHYACAGGYFNICELLIGNGAKVNVSDYKHWTPLHIAVTKMHKDITELLLKNNANIHALLPHSLSPNRGKTTASMCIHFAAIKGNKEITNLLLKYGANINDIDLSNRTALHYAAYRNNTEYVRFLIYEKKASVNIFDVHSRLPIHSACLGGVLENVKILVDTGSLVQKKDIYNMSPLDIAHIKKFKHIKRFLTKYANENFRPSGELYADDCGGSGDCGGRTEGGEPFESTDSVGEGHEKSKKNDIEKKNGEVICLRSTPNSVEVIDEGKMDPKEFYNDNKMIKDILTTTISTILKERNVDQIKRVVDALGVYISLSLLEKTILIQNYGGIQLVNKQGKRSTGGVFFYLIKYMYKNDIISKFKYDYIVEEEKEKKKTYRKLKKKLLQEEESGGKVVGVNKSVGSITAAVGGRGGIQAGKMKGHNFTEEKKKEQEKRNGKGNGNVKGSADVNGCGGVQGEGKHVSSVGEKEEQQTRGIYKSGKKAHLKNPRNGTFNRDNKGISKEGEHYERTAKSEGIIPNANKVVKMGNMINNSGHFLPNKYNKQVKCNNEYTNLSTYPQNNFKEFICKEGRNSLKFYNNKNGHILNDASVHGTEDKGKKMKKKKKKNTYSNTNNQLHNTTYLTKGNEESAYLNLVQNVYGNFRNMHGAQHTKKHMSRLSNTGGENEHFQVDAFGGMGNISNVGNSNKGNVMNSASAVSNISCLAGIGDIGNGGNPGSPGNMSKFMNYQNSLVPYMSNLQNGAFDYMMVAKNNYANYLSGQNMYLINNLCKMYGSGNQKFLLNDMDNNLYYGAYQKM